jgi:hypothetical protein
MSDPGFGTQPPSGDQPPFGGQPTYGGFGAAPQYGGQPQPQPQYGNQPQYGGQPSYGQQPTYGGQPPLGGQPQFGAQPQYGGQPPYGGPPPFGYPPAPPAPNNKRTVLLWSVVGVVVVVAAVLVTGLAWPGWMNKSTPATSSATAPTSHDVCSLLPIGQVGQAVDVTTLTPQPQGPIYDPITHTPAYLCTYADSAGQVLADIEVADYPTSVNAQQLVRGVATTGNDFTPVTGVGDAAATVSDLGNGDNTALITARANPKALHLVVIGIATQADPTQQKLVQLANTALNAG